MRSLRIYIAICLSATVVLIGCSRTKQRNRIAQAYADVLIAEQQIQGDSLGRLKLIDSVLKVYGYASQNELREDIRSAAENPDALRAILDTAQRRMEGVRDRK